MQRPLLFLVSLLSLAAATPNLFSPFDAPFIEESFVVSNDSSPLELLKRQGNACPSGFGSCVNIGAPQVCCQNNQVCTADAANHAACCPSKAVCTGTIAQQTYNPGTVNMGTGTTSTTTGAVAGGGVIATTTTTNAATGVTTTSTTSTTSGGGFIVAGSNTVAVIPGSSSGALLRQPPTVIAILVHLFSAPSSASQIIRAIWER